MPYYLVTHTSLVETLDEATAAHAVAKNLRVADQIPFTVKLDSEHITHIVVSQPPEDRPFFGSEEAVEPTGVDEGVRVAQGSSPPSGQHRLPINAKVILLLIASLSLGLASGPMIL